jgi:hypothetical protein
MTLGTLKDEKSEPMNREQFEAVRKCIHVSWKGDVLIRERNRTGSG